MTKYVAVYLGIFYYKAKLIFAFKSALGIVGGKGNSIFDPNGNITRQEAAVMLTRAAKWLGLAGAVRKQSLPTSMKMAGCAKEAVAFVSSVEDKTNRAKKKLYHATDAARASSPAEN